MTSTDNATYTGTGTFTVTVDTTAPATSSSLSPSPNGAGWTAANTTVSLTATDDGSGVASITYSASGAQTIGSTVVSGSAAAPVISSEGTTTVSFFATDNVGNVEATKTVTVMLDKTSPTNSLSITAASGAFFSGGTLFYKGNAAGSFKLVDAVTDNTSGPASATFGAIATTGWTHNAETLSSGTGGAPTITYTSSTYSWTASPSNPAAQAIAAADIAGNSGTTGGGVSFASDTTAPSGGSVTVPAYVKTASVSVTFSAGSDGSGSGVNSASGQLLRASAAYTESTDTCGSFGSFSNVGSAGASSPFTDATVSTGNCYEYEYQVSDNVGNTATYGPSGTVKIDTTAPSVTAIASQESGGGAGDGQLQSGDKLVITFGDRLDPTTVPASGTGSESRKTTGATTTLTITGITSGAVSTGSTGYFAQSGSRTATFSYTAALSSNNTVVTVTITSLSGDTTAAGSGALAFTPANTIADPAGNTAAGTFTTASTFKLF